MPKNDTLNRLQRITCLGGFIALFIALLIAVRAGSTAGYEITIYSTYPILFWILVASGLVFSTTVVLIQAFLPRGDSFHLIGVSMTIMFYILLLGVPIIRGYAVYPKGDALSHLGFVRDIVDNGKTTGGDFYPTSHIEGAFITLVSSCNLNSISQILTITHTIAFLLGVYVLAQSTMGCQKNRAMVAVALAAPLYFSFLHTLVHPSVLSTFMIPLLIFSYHKRGISRKKKIALTMCVGTLAFTITISHPITALFAGAVFVALAVARWSITRQKEIKNGAPIHWGGIADNPMTLAAFILVMFFAWYKSYSIFQGGVMDFYEFVVSGDDASLYEYGMNSLTRADLPLDQTLCILLSRYGNIAIYAILSISLITMMTITKHPMKRDLEEASRVYSIVLIAATVVSILSLIGYTGEYDVMRVSRFFLLFAPITAGIAAARILGPRTRESGKRTTAIVALVLIVLVLTSVHSTFGIYGSSRTMQPNWQVTQTELEGVLWLEDHGDEHTPTASPDPVGVKRLLDFWFGTDGAVTQEFQIDENPLPTHIGYDIHDSVTHIFEHDTRYIAISQSDTQSALALPEEIRDVAYQYTASDVKQLSNDSAASLVFSNGGFYVWKI